MYNFGDCFLQEGVPFDPTISSVGPITTPEALYLGRVYFVFVNGLMRRVRIVKNTHSVPLTYGQVCVYSTAAGRWRKDVVLSTSDTDAPAGVVEDTYTAGVPVGYWFRLVEFAEDHWVWLGTTNSARYTIANGGIIVSSSDDGYVWGQNSAASNAAVQNRVGFLKQAVTNQTDNLVATRVKAEINILLGSAL